MSVVPTRLFGCQQPLGAWINARAMLPDLFEAYALKREVSDDDLISAAKEVRETSAYPFILSGFAKNFLRFFRDINELEKAETRFFSVGINPAAIWGADTTVAQAYVRRFSGSEVWRINREEPILSESQTGMLGRALEWIDDGGKANAPMENNLPMSHPTKGKRWQVLAKTLYALPPDVYDQLLSVVYGSGMAHRLPMPQELKDVLNGIPGAIAKGSRTEAAHFIFNDPVCALYAIAQGIDGIDDPVRFVEVHLPAYVHALADPRLLIASMQALGTQDKPVAPPFPKDGNWDALPALMEKFGFDPVSVARWYWVVSALEPQVDQHLKIAFASRLRPFYEQAARESSQTEYFEDVMERVSRLTGMGVEDAGAWLAWKYTMPFSVDNHVTSVQYRYHATEGARGVWGQMLRENTMTLDHVFETMRKRKKRPVKSTTPWGQALQTIVETQNSFFARSLLKTEKKNRILAALEELGYPNIAALQAQFPSWQTDEDAARKVQTIRAHLLKLKLIRE